MGQTPDEIRREIAQTREQMTETMLAIKQKMDLPARVKGRFVTTKAGKGEGQGGAGEAGGGNVRYLAAGSLILGLVVGGLVLRVRSARRRKESS